jgi:hypothetical protein
MIMNKLGKLVLVGVLSTISLPALAHDRRKDRHEDNERHDRDGRRPHDEHCRHDRDRAAPSWRGGAPVRREAWVPGHWAGQGHGRVWIEAGWVLPPRPEWTWIAPRWVRTGNAWVWQEGRWSPRA